MNHGFTLLETLVAFAILSLVTITGFTILSDNLRAIRLIEKRDTFQTRAESLEIMMAVDLKYNGELKDGLNVVETAIGGPGAIGLRPVRLQISVGETKLRDTILLKR